MRGLEREKNGGEGEQNKEEQGAKGGGWEAEGRKKTGWAEEQSGEYLEKGHN